MTRDKNGVLHVVGGTDAEVADVAVEQTPVIDRIEECLLWLLQQVGQPMSRAALRSRVAREPGPWTTEQAVEALESFGLRCKVQGFDTVVAEETGIAVAIPADGAPFVYAGELSAGRPMIYDPQVGPRAIPLTAERLAQDATGVLLQVERPLRESGARASQPQGRFGHWFWGPILQSKPLYWQVGVAALFANLFALTSSIFSMIVYDRVMPNNAVDTLVALVLGVGLVLLGDFAIRSLRAYFLDLAGARADMVIADTIFDQMVEMEMKARRGSAGALASVVREFESLREFFTSSTLTALLDIPFAIIFLVVIFAIGGPLGWVPVAVAPLVVLAGLIVQPRLRSLTAVAQEDGHTKQGVIVETLHGIETIKSLGAGSVMRRRWQESVAHHAAVSMKMRLLSMVATNVASLGSQLVWVGTITYGFFLIRDGEIGSGAIVACSMLAGRTIAPLAQLTQLLTRLNQTLASYKALDGIMRAPREHVRNEAYVERDVMAGSIEFRDVHFAYPGERQGALNGVSFKIQANERVALIGRMGSGKSTIAALLMGFYRPDKGEILVDGVDIRQLDPSDLRRNVGAVLQDIWLVSGTVRDNISLGSYAPTDEQIIQAAKVSGVHDFVSAHPDGYGFKLRERGIGLSGGQRQSIAMARALIGQPPILVLDEPTSASDINAERGLIDRLKQTDAVRTVLLITHRPTMLELVDRVIVVEGGKVMADGPKATILNQAAATLRTANGQKQS